MRNLTRASKELFRRTPDECFPSLGVLADHCRWQKQESAEIWQSPRMLGTSPSDGGRLMLTGADTDPLQMNDWSFSQLCRLARVSKETVNRLTPETADSVFRETLPRGGKPLQLFTQGGTLRSIHAPSYTRLHNTDILDIVQEFAVDFEPAPKGANGGTGLYAGEQDAFCFLIDPAGWTEIGGEAFAPGFFVWNSEVGSRSVGIETFWCQKVCGNHIVWDAIEVVEFSRKHTANVHEALTDIRQIIERLVAKRDQRRDGFAKVIQRAMETRLGDDVEEVTKTLRANGISAALAEEATKVARQQGSLTIFALVDALTRISHRLRYAADRTAADQKAARLLTLAV